MAPNPCKISLNSQQEETRKKNQEIDDLKRACQADEYKAAYHVAVTERQIIKGRVDSIQTLQERVTALTNIQEENVSIIAVSSLENSFPHYHPENDG